MLIINVLQFYQGKKINVTRQTISNWELGETSSNPEQLKLLSKALNISIDELLSNDIKPISIEKTSNIERLAGLMIKILKIIGIGIIVIVIIILLTNTVVTSDVDTPSVEEQSTLNE